MRETAIEKYLTKKVKAEGGICYKWVSPGQRGVPDRIAIFPGGKVYFVELKAPGKEAEPLQIRQHRILNNLACHVIVIDNKLDVDLFLEEVAK